MNHKLHIEIYHEYQKPCEIDGPTSISAPLYLKNCTLGIAQRFQLERLTYPPSLLQSRSSLSVLDGSPVVDLQTHLVSASKR
jgi:hypothetical protein